MSTIISPAKNESAAHKKYQFKQLSSRDAAGSIHARITAVMIESLDDVVISTLIGWPDHQLECSSGRHVWL